jgi:hypothetical protein
MLRTQNPNPCLMNFTIDSKTLVSWRLVKESYIQDIR